MKKKCLCYVLLPIFSVIGILGISWVVAAFIEIFTNNLTMIRIIESNLVNSHLGDDMENYHGGVGEHIMDDSDDNVFWFVQVWLSVYRLLFQRLYLMSSLYVNHIHFVQNSQDPIIFLILFEQKMDFPFRFQIFILVNSTTSGSLIIVLKIFSHFVDFS